MFCEPCHHAMVTRLSAETVQLILASRRRRQPPRWVDATMFKVTSTCPQCGAQELVGYIP